MTELNEIYKCEACGNVVSIVAKGIGNLVCCGELMKKLEEKTAAEEGKEPERIGEKKEEGEEGAAAEGDKKKEEKK